MKASRPHKEHSSSQRNFLRVKFSKRLRRLPLAARKSFLEQAATGAATVRDSVCGGRWPVAQNAACSKAVVCIAGDPADSRGASRSHGAGGLPVLLPSIQTVRRSLQFVSAQRRLMFLPRWVLPNQVVSPGGRGAVRAVRRVHGGLHRAAQHLQIHVHPAELPAVPDWGLHRLRPWSLGSCSELHQTYAVESARFRAHCCP